MNNENFDLELNNDVENFNAYWTERYPAMIKFIDDQAALIPRDKLRFKDVDESIGNSLGNVNVPAPYNKYFDVISRAEVKKQSKHELD